MNFSIAFAIDVILFLVCLWCIWQGSERSVFNPAYWWLVLHAYTVTFRLGELVHGIGPPAFLGSVTDADLLKAAAAADISLCAITLATVLAPYLLRDRPALAQPIPPARLNEPLGKVLVWTCICLGIFSMVKLGGLASTASSHGLDVSTVDLGEAQGSALPFIVSGFAAQGFVIWFSMRGFSRWLVLLMVPVLIATAIATTRAFFLLPVLLCFLIQQTRKKRRAIPVVWLVGLVFLGGIWFLGKTLALAIITDADARTALQLAQGDLETKVDNGASVDTSFLDMQAMYMAAADAAGKRYYGSTILPLLSLPIPRFLWPEKPGINAYAVELSTGSREISRMGLTPNLSGESYVNMGWFGCFLIPFVYLFLMQIAFLCTKDPPYFTTGWWLYLLFLVCMLQIYRDGLISVVIFPLLYYFPVFIWGLASYILNRLRAAQQSISQPLVLER